MGNGCARSRDPESGGNGFRIVSTRRKGDASGGEPISTTVESPWIFTTWTSRRYRAQAGIFPVEEEEAEADYANGLSVCLPVE